MRSVLFLRVVKQAHSSNGSRTQAPRCKAIAAGSGHFAAGRENRTARGQECCNAIAGQTAQREFRHARREDRARPCDCKALLNVDHPTRRATYLWFDGIRLVAAGSLPCSVGRTSSTGARRPCQKVKCVGGKSCGRKVKGQLRGRPLVFHACAPCVATVRWRSEPECGGAHLLRRVRGVPVLCAVSSRARTTRPVGLTLDRKRAVRADGRKWWSLCVCHCLLRFIVRVSSKFILPVFNLLRLSGCRALIPGAL